MWCAQMALMMFGAMTAASVAGASWGQVTFVDDSIEAGVGAESYGRGAAMVDVDGDGRLDLLCANDNMPNFFYRQLHDGSFEPAEASWQIDLLSRSSWAILAADFDNDGDNDLYFVNGGFPGQPNRLLRNDLATTDRFTDVSDVAGDANYSQRNFGGTTLDYNRDGRLDIFLTSPSGSNVLLRNDGDLMFTDVSTEAGVSISGAYRHCSIGDYNNDGWIDIAVGGFQGANRVFRNDGDGTFTEVAAALGVSSPNLNFGLVFEDFDNDGWMDLFLPKYQYQDPTTGTTELFRNNGDGTFTDLSAATGMTAQTDMGHNTGDVDGDGYPDIFIGTGHPGYTSDDVLWLMGSDGAGGFTASDVSESSEITSSGPTRCHGVAFGDYDNDGDIDIYTNNGGPPSSPDQLQENFLWTNQGTVNTWTALRLVGVESNRTAVGARSRAIMNSGRVVHRMLRVGNGFGNTDSHIQHYGVLPGEVVQRIEITWPNGTEQVVLSPPMRVVTEVTEASGEICPRDFNNDGEVNAPDVARLLSNWGTDGPGDIDGDEVVDSADLMLLIEGWGDCG